MTASRIPELALGMDHAPSTSDSVDVRIARAIHALGRRPDLMRGEECVAFDTVVRHDRSASQVRQVVLHGLTRSITIFVKAFHGRPADLDTKSNERRALTEFETLRALHERFPARPGVSTVRPIAVFERDAVIVTEAVPGETLSTLIHSIGLRWNATKADRDVLLAAMRRTADWVLTLQSLTPSTALSLEAVERYWQARIDILQDAFPWFHDGLSRNLIEFLHHRWSELSASDRIAVERHADLTLENVLVDTTSVCAIDVNPGPPGNRMQDIAHLFLHCELVREKPWISAAMIDAMQHELLEAFQPGLTPEHPLFQIAHTQQVLAGLVRNASSSTDPARQLYRSFLWRKVVRNLRVSAQP